MNEKDARARIRTLTNEIERHSRLYHTLDAPEISDEAYDAMVRELRDLEEKFPKFIFHTSPTQKVGDVVQEHFEKVRHQVPQWSYDNIFSYEELVAWEEKVKRLIVKDPALASEKLDYCVELKIDGLKVVLTYENGVFVQGATRGNGEVGENITENLKTIKSIPHTIPVKGTFIAIGEAWISQSELERINREREKEDLPVYANVRNLAAGSLRQLDTSITRSRNLQTFVYDIGLSDQKFLEHDDELKFLDQMCKFSVNDQYRVCRTLKEVENFYTAWAKKRHKQPYDVDGLVIKINSQTICRALGYTAKAPRFAVAYKFPAEETTTIVEDIVLQIGRTGILTPVAHLRPVRIAGSVVSRATLHNEDEMRRLDIKIGDTVVLKKAGDVIPKVIRVLPNLRTGKEKDFSFEEYCRTHDLSVRREVSGKGDDQTVAWYVRNKNLFALRLEGIIHFANKRAFNIVGLGDKIVERVMRAGLVNDPADLFELEPGDLLELEGFQELSAQNVIDAIQKSRTVSFGRFLNALGIRHVGEETAELLAETYPTLNDLLKASLEDLEKIDGIGPKIAESIVEWFAKSEHEDLIKRLQKHIIITYAPIKKKGKFSGMTFVITGTLEKFSRDEAKDMIKKLGGLVSGSVSSKTSYVLAGDNAGSKLTDAERLDIKVLLEKDFIKMTE